MCQRRKARGAEGVGEQDGVGALRAVVQVPRGGLDVGVAHPRLDLHEGRLVDGHGSEADVLNPYRHQKETRAQMRRRHQVAPAQPTQQLQQHRELL